MRFHAHILPTYYPDLNPPFDVYVQQMLEQIQLAEELGLECFWFTEHHFVLYGGPGAQPGRHDRAPPRPVPRASTSAARSRS